MHVVWRASYPAAPNSSNILLEFGDHLAKLGRDSCSEALFYYFRPKDPVPENHPLQLIERHISFTFVCEKLKRVSGNSSKP
jgi:hypothetical protein